MIWLNFQTKLRDAPEFTGSTLEQRGAWFSMMLYCTERETGGVIKDCATWNDRQWMQACGITQAEAMSACELWKVDESSVFVWGYPIEKEAEVQAKRKSGRIGGLKSGASRKRRKPQPDEAQLEAPLEAQPERNGNWKGKGNNPRQDNTSGSQVGEHGKNNFILTRPEQAVRVDLSDERNLYRADVISIACSICDLFPDKSGKSGGAAGQITKCLRTLAAHKGGSASGDAEASEIVRPMLIKFWSEIKAGEDPDSRPAVLITKLNRLLEEHGCPLKKI